MATSLSDTEAFIPDAHHETGPSSLKLIELCPSYEKKAEAASDPNAAATEGTILHDALEKGEMPAKHAKNGFLMGLFRRTLAVVNPLTEGADEIHREIRLNIGKTEEESLLFGTADVVAAFKSDRRVVGIDYKFGEFLVEHPSVNPQVQAYVLGIFELYPWCDTVQFFLLSPKQAEDVVSHTFLRERDFDRIRLRIETILARRDQGIVTPVPEVCRFCEKMATCATLRAQVLPLAQRYAVEDTGLTVLPEVDMDTIFESPATMAENKQKVAMLLDLFSFMTKYDRAIRELVKSVMVEHGLELPDYKLMHRQKKQARPSYQYEDDDAVMAIAFGEFKVDPLEYIRCNGRLQKGALERALMARFQEDVPAGIEALTRFRMRLDKEQLWEEPPEDEGNPRIAILTRSRTAPAHKLFAKHIQSFVDDKAAAKKAARRKKVPASVTALAKAHAIKQAKASRGKKTFKVDTRTGKVSEK